MMKASSGFSTAPPGTAGRTGGTNAQCFSYRAPPSIHRRRIAFSATESVLCDFGGGMISSRSCVLIRDHNSLPFKSFGLMITAPLSPLPNAPSSVSNRISDFRFFASKPWQAKQFSARIGRISRLNAKSLPGAATTVIPKNTTESPH